MAEDRFAPSTHTDAASAENGLFTGARARLDGPQLFARYAFMPNRLTYCGGDDNRALFDYCLEEVTDDGLRGLLRKFTGAMPYLRLIAECNAILDPFDARVVEAYWLGNNLLQGVEARALYNSLRDRFGPRCAPATSNWCWAKRPQARTRTTAFTSWRCVRATDGPRRARLWIIAVSVGAK